MAGIAGQEQSRFGPSLALLGRDRLASGRFHLRRVAFHHASVATACADVMGDFSRSVGGNRHVSPFSATPSRESIQRDSAARLFLCHLRSVPFSNRYRDHDVARAGCTVSLVPQNHWRPSGSAQFALYRSNHLYRFHHRCRHRVPFLGDVVLVVCSVAGKAPVGNRRRFVAATPFSSLEFAARLFTRFGVCAYQRASATQRNVSQTCRVWVRRLAAGGKWISEEKLKPLAK